MTADKMEGKEAGYLVSKKPYKDFVRRVEFWPSDDAPAQHGRCARRLDRHFFRMPVLMFPSCWTAAFAAGVLYVGRDPLPS